MGEVVDDYYFVTLGLEPIDQVGPEEPGATGDDDEHGIPPWSAGAEFSGRLSGRGMHRTRPPVHAPRRPVGEPDAADEGVAWHRSEVAAVAAGGPVVAEHQVLGRPEPQVQPVAPASFEVGLVQDAAVDLDPALGQSHPLTGKPDHPLHHLEPAGAGQDHQVASGGGAVERADRDALAGDQRWPHALALDEHGLQPGQTAGHGGEGQGAQRGRGGQQAAAPPGSTGPAHGGMMPRRWCAAKAAVVVPSGGVAQRKGTMPMTAKRVAAWLRPTRVVHAHCDLPCGVYDPAQARIEAESMAKIVEKYHATDDPVFRDRALFIK